MRVYELGALLLQLRITVLATCMSPTTAVHISSIRVQLSTRISNARFHNNETVTCTYCRKRQYRFAVKLRLPIAGQ